MSFLEDLRKIALEEISRHKNDNFRCHEIVRMIGNKLESLGISVKIRDGIAVYNTSDLLREFFSEELSDHFSEEAIRETLEQEGGGLLLVVHSWCEVIGKRNEKNIIDWHYNLRLTQESALQFFLIVEEKSKLRHKYFSTGFRVGKWLILFRPRLVSLLRLRL